MPTSDWFAVKHGEWKAAGSPPCSHRRVGVWQDWSEGADGFGCADCGQWFEQPPDRRDR